VSTRGETPHVVHYEIGSPACEEDGVEIPEDEPDTREIIDVTCEKCLAKVAEWASEDSLRRMRRIATLRVKLAEAKAEIADLKQRMANVSSRLLRDLREISDVAKARKKIEGGAP
jgi:hypothetical protein